MASGLPPQSLRSTFYSPLQSEDEIRLLFLQPLGADSKVICKLQHAKLSSRPQYEALSYCWGLITTQTVSIEGQDAQVRTNLWAALKQLSPTQGTRCLWIDAVCINQVDTEERNQQVAQMGKIYGQATSVVVWLGPESEDSQLAFKLLVDPPTWQKMWESTTERPLDEALEVTLHPFVKLCEREYWHRLWIIQEIFLAQKISIHCGSNCTSWLRLSWFFCSFPNQHEAVDLMSGLPPNLEAFAQAIKSSIPWRFFTHNRRTSARGQNPITLKPKAAIPPPPLHYLCNEYGQALCEDPKDKVYGLHALASDCCKSQVRVDYSVSVQDIWTKLLQHIVFGRHTVGLYEGAEALIRDIQLLHKSLNVSPHAYREYIQPLIDVGVSAASMSVKQTSAIIIEGRARGVITYISPPLNEPLSSNVPTKFPEFTPWNAAEIIYIYNWLPQEQNHAPPFMTTSFDIVKPIATSHTITPLTTSHNFASTFKYLDFSTLWKPQESPLVQDDLVFRFLAILRAAHAAIPPSYAPTCRLAVEQNGMICFVPSNAQLGDMILQFRGCATLGLIRTQTQESALSSPAGPSAHHMLLSSLWKALTPASAPTPSLFGTMPSDARFRIIGRAVNFVPTSETMLYDTAGADLSKHWARLNGRRMDLEGDFATLRDLTIASEGGEEVLS